MNNNGNRQFCYFCKWYNHGQEECCTRMQENQPCMNRQGRGYWPKRYAAEEEARQGEVSPILALSGFVEPLMQNPMVIPQLLLSLCMVSLTTCNKLFKIFAPGDKVRPSINVKTGNQTTSWLFDTGAAITCMNSQSLNTAFGQQKPRKISNAQSCIAASGDAMNSVGVYKVDLWIKGRKFTHPINVITELNDNIIGIDFMHKHKLIYDVHT